MITPPRKEKDINEPERTRIKSILSALVCVDPHPKLRLWKARVVDRLLSSRKPIISFHLRNLLDHPLAVFEIRPHIVIVCIVGAIAKDRCENISISLRVLLHCNRHSEPWLGEIGFGQFWWDKRRIIIVEHDQVWFILSEVLRGQAAIVRNELIV